ncbi:MAG TPA: hypothetical protein PK990_00145, partial [Salinivirgaceae bacterium]|nr:hypothetical protein [Salinivirgaceae bacterium]
MFRKKLWITLFYTFVILPFALSAQNNVTSRIYIVRGSNVVFNFSNYSRYANGVSLERFTHLRLYFNDTITGGIPNPSGTGWALKVRSVQNNISGDMWGNVLSLSTIQIRAHYNGSDFGPFTLTNIDQTIVTGPDLLSFNGIVEISYDCGTLPTNNLINQLPDVYLLDL